MAKVSLDGVRIEIPTAASPPELLDRAGLLLQALSAEKFRDWALSIEREEQRLVVHGQRGETHFDAVLTPLEGRVVVTVQGAASLSTLKLTLAGGARGVRERVRARLADVLREHLS